MGEKSMEYPQTAQDTVPPASSSSTPSGNNPVRAFSGPPHLQKAQLWKPRRIFGAPACLLKGLPAVLPKQHQFPHLSYT